VIGRRLRNASAALLVWLALSSVAAMASTQRDELVARWVAANDARIAAIHDPKARAKAQATFTKLAAGLDERNTPQDLPNFSAAAQRELATPGRYHLSTKIAPPPAQPWYQQIWDWVQEQFKKLWDSLYGRVHIGSGGTVAIGELLIGLAILALVFGVIRLLAEYQIDRRKRSVAVEALRAPQDARVLYERAHAAARKGDFAAASRLLFAASVVALDLRGVVTEDPSATVGDLRRVLRAREAGLVPPFDAVSAPFIASAYAERPIETADWERARDAFLSFAPDRGAG
jgi:hypothetical protein